MDSFFKIVDLKVSIDDNLILKKIDLEVGKGEIHAIMGPNGSGKTTLSNVIMGNPKYKVEGGRIFFKGEDITNLPPNERAKRGIFLAFQHPVEVQGVRLINFLRTAYSVLNCYRLKDTFVPPKPIEFRNFIKSKMELLEIDDSFMTRYLNEGFSGGEKKKSEILQMLLLQPELAIMDEIDSGLDIDALRVISESITKFRNSNNAFIVITHYSRIFKYLKPDFVHILNGGRIVKTGDYTLAEKIEEEGYDWTLEELSTSIT
ncbi:MAG: Fe-S cluster assembly ATPase SufC [Brevinematia bacterium]